MTIEIWRQMEVDRIALTVTPSKTLHGFAWSQMKEMVALQSDLFPSSRLRVRPEKFLTRFEYYTKSSGSAKWRLSTDVAIGQNKLFGGGHIHRYLTMTVYPPRCREGQFAAFNDAMKNMLEDFQYEQLFQNARVNYLELAVDSNTYERSNLLAYRPYAKASDVWPEASGESGSIKLGSPTSDLIISVYDKKRQALAKGLAPSTKVLPHTRIEAKIRRLQMTVPDLLGLKNPFLKIQFADLAYATHVFDDPGAQEFLINSIVFGVPAALAANPATRKEYMKRLKGCHVGWWKPEEVWLDLPKALSKITPDALTGVP